MRRESASGTILSEFLCARRAFLRENASTRLTAPREICRTDLVIYYVLRRYANLAYSLCESQHVSIYKTRDPKLIQLNSFARTNLSIIVDRFGPKIEKPHGNIQILKIKLKRSLQRLDHRDHCSTLRLYVTSAV